MSFTLPVTVEALTLDACGRGRAADVAGAALVVHEATPTEAEATRANAEGISTLMRRPDGQHRSVRSAHAPRTRASLAADLRALGVQPGMTLMVHASLRALGWVAGGPNAVIEALQDVLTPEGILAMPTFTDGLTDPSVWQNRPCPRRGGRSSGRRPPRTKGAPRPPGEWARSRRYSARTRG